MKEQTVLYRYGLSGNLLMYGVHMDLDWCQGHWDGVDQRNWNDVGQGIQDGVVQGVSGMGTVSIGFNCPNTSISVYK